MINLTYNTNDFALPMIFDNARKIMRCQMVKRRLYLYGFKDLSKADVCLTLPETDAIAQAVEFLEERGIKVEMKPDFVHPSAIGFSVEMRQKRLQECIACVILVALAVNKRLLKPKPKVKTSDEKWQSAMDDLVNLAKV